MRASGDAPARVPPWRLERDGKLFAYDPAGKRHELVHSDSLHGSLVTFTGSAVPDGFAFEAEIHLRRTITLRQEYRLLGETIAVERKRRFDGGEAWTTVWKATYQKTR
jgi:hypothetical protein